GILAAENRERATRLRPSQHVQRITTRHAPRFGRDDHPVEGDRAMEATGAGGAERLHATHAEPEHTDALAFGRVRGRLEVAEHAVEVDGHLHALLERDVFLSRPGLD